jgi:hypothetical protein
VRLVVLVVRVILTSRENSLQKLSIDFTKASEALRAWGVGEGEDLGVCIAAVSRARLTEFMD